jgi:DNA polymerase III epsilon subunit family exonuclease
MIYIAFDTETTGVEPGSRLLELAAYAVDEDTGEAVSKFCRMVNPGMPLPPDAAAINRITPQELAEAPSAASVLRDFADWIEDLPSYPPLLVAHWAQYDAGILCWEFGRAGLPQLDLQVACTCKVAKEIKTTADNKLDTLVEHYGIKRLGVAHRAEADADACMQYFQQVARPWLAKNGTLSSVAFPRLADAGHGYSYIAPEHLPVELRILGAEIAAAVESGSPITMLYRDQKGEETIRTVTPYGWALVRGTPMWHGYCHLRNERRTFRMDGCFKAESGANG